MEQQFEIGKDQSMAIKGIAIVMMVALHLFTIPHWWVEECPEYIYTFARIFNNPLQSCIGIYAFITGWVMGIKNGCSAKEIAAKTAKFLTGYWMVLFVCEGIAFLICGYRPTFFSILRDMSGISAPIMKFSWYVYFYVIVMCSFPVLKKLMDKGLLCAAASGIILPFGLFYGLKTGFSATGAVGSVLAHLGAWMPCVCSGYICYKHKIYTRPAKHIKRFNSMTQLVLYVLIILAYGVMTNISLKGIIVYIPLIIFALKGILEICQNTKIIIIRKIYIGLQNLGAVSTNIWFIHCIFFSDYMRVTTQWILYWPGNPMLIFIWSMLILYTLSYFATKWVNRNLSFVFR